MPTPLSQRAVRIGQHLKNPIGSYLQRGIEREALRVLNNGHLADTPHPAGLGSALANSYITTDFSEALLEFITPVFDGVDETLNFLDDVHRFTYSQLDKELLWNASMPCILVDDEHIPVAQYGNSNIAKMKTVYRVGLGHRYSRLMQTISGIHYNFSLREEFWRELAAAEGYQGELQAFIDDNYMGLIRNFRRYSWLLIYLFGASPAVCNTFLKGRKHDLDYCDTGTRFAPHGTSLRMGRLGYQSDAQEKLRVSYNDLAEYTRDLHDAIATEISEYQTIGLKENGEYKQLSTGLLQIENEFYSTIRPKRPARSDETPTDALRRAGIEYIEVRCLDVNPYLPLGIDAEQIQFVDLFLLYCLLADSPACCEREYQIFGSNRSAIVNRGREPNLTLVDSLRDFESIPMQQWAHEILEDMGRIADTLHLPHSEYHDIIERQAAKIDNPELTPSANILRDMKEQGISWFAFAMQQSQRHASSFRDRPLDKQANACFTEEAAQSILQQAAIEAADDVDFDTFIRDYYQRHYGFSLSDAN